MYLLIALLFPFIVHPMIETEGVGIALMDASFSLLLFVTVFAVSSQKHVRYVALGLTAVAQFFLWFDFIFDGVAHRFVSFGVFSICLIYTTVYLLSRILSRHDVTFNTIFAALCVFMMFGYIWAFSYSMLEMIMPGSFSINQNVFLYTLVGSHLYAELYYFIYYSFTVLTTLGLGDVLPASPWARVFTSAEAIVGQIYLVVLVSRLVGMHISQQKTRDT